MKKKIIILLLSALFPGSGIVFSQASIRGVVSDKASSEALPGVYVLYGKGKGTVTGQAGEYSIAADTGSVTLLFQLIGYKSEERKIHLSKGETVTADIAMELLYVPAPTDGYR
ncbi:MAG: carboxypeptidase-like regulatory domain-containing protein [Bacteroidales bacterium]|nr:carboxypeptidase-like regulatory domain-containing protein [Bacteroidales bacterium]